MVSTTFFKNKGPFSLEEIAKNCDCVLKDEGKKDFKVYNLSDLENCGSGEICSFYDKKAKDKVSKVQAGACITSEEFIPFLNENTIALISANPKASALKLNHMFYDEIKPEAKISKMSDIHSTAKIGKNVSIGSFVSIGENAVIGDDVVIEPNSTIGRYCEIGQGTYIHANVAISYAKIGTNCIIHQCSAIGQDGYGFMFAGGKHNKIPQLGSVIIGNDVEIGANMCVDRGALTDTIIGNGCKFDNLIQIAHGVQIGNNTLVVAQAGIAGSTIVEDYCVIGPQTAVADHLRIGQGSQIAAQSGVMRNLEAGSVVLGTPCLPFKESMKLTAMLHKMIKPKKEA